MTRSSTAETARLFAEVDETKRVWRYLEQPVVEQGRPLPAPTQDWGTLRADYDTHGYCFVVDAAEPDLIRSLKERVIEQFVGEQGLEGVQDRPYGTEAVYNLLNKGEVFSQLLLHPLVDKVIEHSLGESFLLSAFNSHSTKPGSLAQGLHLDQMYIGAPTPMALVCNAVWMLDDFTEENGGTRVIPGSHRWSAEAVAAVYQGLEPASVNAAATIAAQAPAGTCMVFDGRLLHAAGCNRTSDQARYALFAYYCRPFIRQLENPFLSIDDAVMMSLSPEIRKQLGYQPWAFCGGCEGPGRPPPLDVVRPTRRIGLIQSR